MLRRTIVSATLALVATLSLSGACLPDGPQASGAIYRICMPATWNGDLLVYAHGYQSFQEPVGIPEDQLTLPDGTKLPDLVNSLGFAFAMSSYRQTGLAIKEGVDDTADVVNIFTRQVGAPRRVYLAGVSEGGIIAALSMEKIPAVYSGGLAACGPIGDFPGQVNYIGDFRNVFDYFFPDVLPGNPDQIPDELINNWESVYLPAALAAAKANPLKRAQLLNVTNGPVGLDPASVDETIETVLWYSTFTTNDAIAKLGGQPYDNKGKYYRGSLSDLLMNLGLLRYEADAAAVAEMKANYTTTGKLTKPLVTLHTTGDQIIPFWHNQVYGLKVLLQSSLANYASVPVLRYGHCEFETAEVLISFAILVGKVTGAAPVEAFANSLTKPEQKARFYQLAKELGVR